MVQRKVIVRGATNQALDELDAADIPDLSGSYEASGAVATHAGLADPHTGYLKENDANWTDLTDGGDTTLHTHTGGTVDFGEVGDISASGFGDTSAAGATGEVADAGHRHAREANPVTAHEAAGDPHTGYRLESADHSHATTGLQGGTVAHTALTAVGANDHHNQAHVLTGADHTASGLTIGHVLTASSATAFGFAAPASPVLSSASAFATAETTISAATYADIAGCSVSLAAGTWMVYGHVVARAVNAIIQVFVAITHSDNTVISESATSRPASGTANLNSPIAVSWFALVSPGSTTTYKLRGARGLTTHTGSWIAMDGTGVNTTNHATNNTDKGTGIFAIKIA